MISPIIDVIGITSEVHSAMDVRAVADWTVRKRLLAGATRSPGSTQLRLMRERGDGADYLLGVVFNGTGLKGVPEADRKALAEVFSAGEAAIAPDTVAIAGFRKDGALRVEARVLYQAP